MSNADVVVKLSLENKQLASELAKTERRYKSAMKRMEKDTQSFGASVAGSMTLTNWRLRPSSWVSALRYSRS